jgi:hypothetical protein
MRKSIAKDRADILKLSPNEWIFIPIESAPERADKLKGKKVANEKYLIGYFSDIERDELLRK